jgi:hypothetical protein
VVSPLIVLNEFGWRPTEYHPKYVRGPCIANKCLDWYNRCFDVTAERALCFRCQWWGDSIALYARLSGLTTLEAAYAMCERWRIPPPYLPNKNT